MWPKTCIKTVYCTPNTLSKTIHSRILIDLFGRFRDSFLCHNTVILRMYVSSPIHIVIFSFAFQVQNINICLGWYKLKTYFTHYLDPIGWLEWGSVYQLFFWYMFSIPLLNTIVQFALLISSQKLIARNQNIIIWAYKTSISGAKTLINYTSHCKQTIITGK